MIISKNEILTLKRILFDEKTPNDYNLIEVAQIIVGGKSFKLGKIIYFTSRSQISCIVLR